MTTHFNARVSVLSRRVFVGALLFGAVAGLSAFQGTSTSHPVTVRSLIIEDDRGNVAYMHIDHWHGSMRVSPDTARKYNIYYVDTIADMRSHGMPSRDDWKVFPKNEKYEIVATMQESDIVDWKPESVTGGTLIPRASEGRTQLTFVVLYDKKEIYKAAPITAGVQAPRVRDTTGKQ